MTREEAITKYIVPAIEKTWNDKRCKEILKALEQEPCEIIHSCTYGGVSWGGTYKPQEPCEDAISRQAAIEAVKQAIYNHDSAIMRLTELPSVKPQEPKTIQEKGE